jgi:hypothetical protein
MELYTENFSQNLISSPTGILKDKHCSETFSVDTVSQSNDKYLHYFWCWKVWLSLWLIGGFSPWRPGFNPRVGHVGFVVDRVELGKFSLQALQFFAANYHSIIAPYSFVIRGWVTGSIWSCSTKGFSLTPLLKIMVIFKMYVFEDLVKACRLEMTVFFKEFSWGISSQCRIMY